MSEIWALKVSRATDLSPTTIFSLGAGGPGHSRMSTGWREGCTRGGAGWVPGRAIPVPRPVPAISPYSVIFSLKALPTAK